jgi:hypothetical protein
VQEDRGGGFWCFSAPQGGGSFGRGGSFGLLLFSPGGVFWRGGVFLGDFLGRSPVTSPVVIFFFPS